MQIQVTTRHGQLNESTKEKLTAKAGKLLKFHDRLSAIEIVVELKDPNRPRVDINVSAEHNHDFVAHDQGENLIAAFDGALNKLEQQLRKHKEKLLGRHRDPAVKRAEEAADAIDEEPEA